MCRLGGRFTSFLVKLAIVFIIFVVCEQELKLVVCVCRGEEEGEGGEGWEPLPRCLLR